VGGKTVAVTSVGSDDGRTSTALQIATAATREHQRVLVIDADGRERRLSHYVGADGGASPRGRHDGPAARGEQAGARRYQGRLVTTAGGAVLPIDADEPDEGAEVHRVVDVRDAVRSIGDAYDLVLVDAPALLTSSNALDVAGQADGLVLVVPHRVAVRDLREARDRLAFVKTPLLGYVYVRPPGIRARRTPPRG
jgi:Mrp family chromosome partitioning ATPase